jgi:hypothetical protein
MDATATFIGYGVLIFVGLWVVGQIIEKNDTTNEKIKGTETYINSLHHELALRKLYWDSSDEQDKNAIKTFSMSGPYKGWAFIVQPEDEYLKSKNELGFMKEYNAAMMKLKIEGSPFKLENHQVLPAKGDRHFFP